MIPEVGRESGMYELVKAYSIQPKEREKDNVTLNLSVCSIHSFLYISYPHEGNKIEEEAAACRNDPH